jgi:hypothetical protein
LYAAYFFGVLSSAFFELPPQVEIVPAYDAVFDQAITGLCDFLFLLLGLGELARIANSNCAG